jgi:carboxypeptidase C (cathepsin A)
VRAGEGARWETIVLKQTLTCGAVSVLLAASLAAQTPGGRGSGPGPAAGRGPGRGGGAAAAADDDARAGVPAVEKVSTTHHTATIHGTSIVYTANAGTMVLRDDDGKPTASVFYVAYTRDNADSSTRPVTFFFNGGPGSSSLWLSMGIMSPKHPEMGPNGAQPAPPYTLVDNPNSPLDATDLVQVDAMMTGYSRPAPGVKPSDFTGARNDIEMFGQFIRRYLDKYHRWQSPKYLFGESYGTFRSAGLAAELQGAEGIELNGVMLLGTVLDLANIRPSPSNDLPYETFLPTYAATAWYHKKLPPDLQAKPLTAVIDEARAYAFGEYMTTLARGNRLPAAERTAAAGKLARLTGLSTTFILNTNLRIDPGSFRTELLRSQREMVGRYDSRMTGLNGNASELQQDYDPANAAPSGAFMSAYMRYLQEDLEYTSDLQYYIQGHAGPWDYSEIAGRGNLGPAYPSTTEALRSAMARNPYLQVLVCAGYYDMATPFANAEYSFNHLGYDQTYRDRVSFKYYESGHMAYLNQTSARALSADIAAFIARTVHQPAMTLEP